MLENDSRSLASGVAGLALVLLLTFPSSIGIGSHFRESKQKSTVYEDKDGVASEESMAEYTAKIPKILLSIFSILGLFTAIALAVLGTLNQDANRMFVENWLNVGEWVHTRESRCHSFLLTNVQFLILIQTIGVLLVRKPVKSYDLGVYAALSCVFLLAAQLYQDGLLSQDDAVESIGPPEEIVLRSSQLALTVFTGFASFSLPRRPHVFINGARVDAMYTVSALDRYSFAWVAHLLKLSRKKNRLNLEDLPKMDHYTRSKDLSQAWAQEKHTRKLWVEVFLTHKWSFIIQWILTLMQAFGNFAPQFVTYHILKLLEARIPGTTVSSEAWIWVITLTITSIGAAWIESWLFWVSWSELAIPIRSQLSALIFQKAMRRKDVKGASKSAKKKNGDGLDISEAALGESASADKPEVDEEDDNDPKGKQSTVNLIGVDTKRVSDFCSFNNYFPGSLFKLIVSFAFLLSIIGWKSLLLGFLAMSLTIPLNIYFSKRYAAAQDRLMKVRDIKMAVVTEALQGMRNHEAARPQY